MQRCAADVSGPGDVEFTVHGWGADEAVARAQALRWARIVAGERFTQDVWAWAFWDDPADHERARSRLAAALPDDPLAVPGVQVEQGPCKAVSPGSAASAWTARWPAGDAVDVTRADPTVAVETARRRACMGAYDATRRAMYEAVAHASAEDKAHIWWEAVGSALDELESCVGRSDPGLSAAQPVELAEESFELVQCRASTTVSVGTIAGTGWAVDVERAGEEALTEFLYSRQRRCLSHGLEASARASAESRQLYLAMAYSETLRGPGNGDLQEAGLLACEGFPAPPVPALAWTPDEPWPLETCGPNLHLPPVSGLDDPADLGGTLSGMCDERTYADVTLVNEAVANASVETQDTMVAAGWHVVLGCEASCRGESVLEGEGTAIPLLGMPDRSTQQAAERALWDAVVQHDMDLLLVVVPSFTDDFFQRIAVENPLATWVTLPMLLQHGLDREQIVWREVGGVWGLHMPD